MAKDSAYYIEKNKNLRLRLAELLEALPIYVREFLEEKEDKNPNTAVAYAQDLIVFFEYMIDFCPEAKNLAIKDIPIELLEKLTYRDINEYENYLDVNKPQVSGTKVHAMNTRSIARKMSTLSGFFKYACEHDYFQNDPTRGAKKPNLKNIDGPIVRLNSDEVRDFLELIKTSAVKSEHQRKILENTQKRDFAILTLLLNTGIRISECIGLDVSAVSFEDNSILVYRKGGKEQYVYFGDAVAETLQDYIINERPNYIENDEEKALFMSTRKTRLAIRSAQQMVKKYADKLFTNKHITAHKMRSTYGTALYNITGDIRLVADVLGHNDINTTAKHYAATEDERKRMAASINVYKNRGNKGQK